MNLPPAFLIRCALILIAVATASRMSLPAAGFEPQSDNPFFRRYQPVKAPAPAGRVLRPGDRLAIIGDSITEQKMYSRIIETYLTVCVPDLKVTARQFGWGGETAEGFLHRMTNDCLRFQPTIATLCYGMNDHRYRAFDEANAQWYSNNYAAVVTGLKAAGARVVLGSPGCVGRIPPWAVNNHATLEDMNLNLGRLRNLDVALAAQQQVGFADVFWPMLVELYAAKEQYGPDYALCGKDGVHPDWAGHLVMAYAFLKALGLDGDLGTFTVDLAADKAAVTSGHTLDSFTNNTLTITSRRYPFCAAGEADKDNSIRSGMTLVPFNAELNRLTLVVKGGAAAHYAVTWGDEKREYSAAQLAAGVNLAADFASNPFADAFAKVDTAVANKQNYETIQIKNLFYTPDAKADPAAMAVLTDKVRQPLVDAMTSALVPVTHTIRIQPE